MHPFLHENELAIDDFISSAHERAKTAGLTYLKHAIDLFKQHVLGLPPKEPSPPSTPSTFSYAQNLISRFNLPSARPAFPVLGATSTATDFYTLLASAVSAATGSTQANNLSNSGTLIPPTVHGEDRISFISAQRERLSILLSALDKEANTLQRGTKDGNLSSEEEHNERPKSSMSGLSMSTRKSEVDFEKIEAESGTEDLETERGSIKRGLSAGGSWMPWSWGSKEEGSGADTPMGDAGDTGRSSGVDI